MTLSNQIHPTAIIGENVHFGSGNVIGPYVVISGDVSIGNNNRFLGSTHLSNRVKIGDNNLIYNHVSIGSPGEMGSKGDVIPENGVVVIGNNNTIREFVNFNFPVRRMTSQIGDNNYIMARSYLAHDCQIANHVVVADNALMGGGCVLSDYAYMGLGSIMHQWLDLGESAILGLQAGVKEHVPPFCVVVGVPGRIMKFNRVGAERRGFAKELVDEVEAHFKSIIAGSYHSENAIVRSIYSFIEQHNDKVLRKFV